MSLLANDFLLLGQEFDEQPSAMFCLLRLAILVLLWGLGAKP
jgi:hypothetical protein